MRRWVLPALLLLAIGVCAWQLDAPVSALAADSAGEATDIKPPAKPADPPEETEPTDSAADDKDAAAESESATAAAPAEGEATEVEPASDPRWPGGEPPLITWRGESPNWVHGQEFTAVAGAKFIGSQECLNCHKELRAAFVQTAHARSMSDVKVSLEQQGCEACHGAGGAHAVLRSRGAIFAFDWQKPDSTNVICLRCHTWLATEKQWHDTAHAGAGLRCTQCHDPHVGVDTPHGMLLVEQEDKLCVSCHARVGHDFKKLSHHPVVMDSANDPGAGAMHCTSCHNVHAGHGPEMLITRRTQDLCLKCHMDKGGPFRFPHMSTEEGMSEGCMTCHDAHGSNSAWLHKAAGNALCAQCHTDRDQHFVGQTCWTSGCHNDIHGSNKHPLFIGP